MAYGCPPPKPGSIEPDWGMYDRNPKPRDPDDLTVYVENGRRKKMTRVQHADYMQELRDREDKLLRGRQEFVFRVGSMFAKVSVTAAVAVCLWRGYHYYDPVWIWNSLATYWGVPMAVIGGLLGFLGAYRLLRKRGELR